ncbi:uncharacterized protein LOC116339921 [Contarinia nasturtii]|uniref:uncharacterized protein LOC116339921 n=1 Tax=Contarinia nasturtii TaxID=265458 RepID=UPI0012D442C3|nr:uncharacterized protein LOC116339921 [Contarinia nasturtii]
MKNIVLIVTIIFVAFAHAVPRQQERPVRIQRGALQEALRMRNVTAAKILIENGANINEIDKHGDVPINIAIEKELTGIIDIMIDSGAVVANLKDKDGNTPLAKAVFQDRGTVIDRLLPLGANIHIKNNYGNSPVLIAATAGFVHLVRKFLDLGANIDSSNNEKITPIMYAAFHGRIDIAKLLIERGANIHLQSVTGKSAVHFAAHKGFGHIVVLLLENGANINVQTVTGTTPLILAVSSGHVEMTRLLIEHGANIHIKTNDTSSNALHVATIKGHLNVVQVLLKNGADIHSKRDRDGNTCTFLAAFYGYDEIIKVFIAFDNNTDVNTKNLEGETPLMAASFNGFDKVVLLLIEFGGDIHDKSNDERTPLMMAVMGGQTNTVKLLIEQGSHINAQDKNGNSPLHHVCIIGEYDKIMDILIENKADFHIKNKLWKEPCDLLDERNRTTTKQTVNIRKACETYGKLTVRRDFGGALAAPGEFPWMAALGYLNLNYNISFDCGATIVSNRFLLTAAHCTKEQRKPVVARLGIVKLDDEAAVNYQIKTIIRHPNYTSETETNDIALLQVSKLIRFTPAIQPATLEMDILDEDNDVSLYVSGWGRSELFEKSNDLLKTQLKTMPLSECNRTLLDWNRDKGIFLPVFRNGISESQYCAFDPNARNDSCQGDSGGPLFRSNSNTSSIIGIVSFGISCGTTLPSVYTRVAYYFDWITANIGMGDNVSSRIIPAQYNTVKLLLEKGANINHKNKMSHTALSYADDKIAQLLV